MSRTKRSDALFGDSSTLLLSIRPRFVDAMRRGEKTVELRKVLPRPMTDHVLIYETAPTSSIVGSAYVSGIVSGDRLFVRDYSAGKDALSLDDFLAYFHDEDKQAYGLVLSEFRWLKSPVTLEGLRARRDGFTPPQSFQYLNDDEVLSLVGDCISFSREVTS